MVGGGPLPGSGPLTRCCVRWRGGRPAHRTNGSPPRRRPWTGVGRTVRRVAIAPVKAWGSGHTLTVPPMTFTYEQAPGMVVEGLHGLSRRHTLDMLLALFSQHAAQTTSLPLWQVALARAAQVAASIALARYCSRQLAVRLSSSHLEDEYELHCYDQHNQGKGANMAFAARTALLVALREMLPRILMVAAYLFSARQTADLLQDVVQVKYNLLCQWFGQTAVTAFGCLRQSDQFFDACLRLLALVTCLWLTIAWKNKLVDMKFELEVAQEERRPRFEEKIVRPLNQAATTLLLGLGLVAAMRQMGVDIGPLLAVTGISGIAFGLGAQSLIASLVSGLNLLLTMPFLVGDRIELKNNIGTTLVAGVVESINPLSVVVRNDRSIPVAIPNRMLVELLICNESKVEVSKVQKLFCDPREISGSISATFSDVKKLSVRLPDLTTSILAFLHRHSGIDNDLPCQCYVKALQSDGTAVLRFIAYTTPRASRDFSHSFLDLTCGLAGVVERFDSCMCKEICLDALEDDS